MSEDQIERAVERKVGRLDACFFKKGQDGKFVMTQAEYDAEHKAIDEWADREYRWLEATRRARCD